MLTKFATRLFRRGKELGWAELIRRSWRRSVYTLRLEGEAMVWGWRARQPLQDSDVLQHLPGWHDMDDLLQHLAQRPASSFLLQQGSPDTLMKHDPKYFSALLAEADALCRDEVHVLGHVFQYPNGVDWQSDPATGYRWRAQYRRKMETFIGSSRPVDLILFWELNRHQNLTLLGLAYWLTKDKRYEQAFIRHLQTWMRVNPLRHGMNWYYPLEVSLRMIAWTIAFQFFRKSNDFQRTIGRDFLHFLYQQALFVRSNLQTIRAQQDVPNNHIIAELTGLIVAGTVFPEFREASEWHETGLRLLKEQVQAQVYTDGVHKEQAAGYQRFVSELLILVAVIQRRRGEKRDPILESALTAMLDHILLSLTPAGTHPMWGDTDFGKALGLRVDHEFWDFRPLLAAGALLFKRADLKFAAGRLDAESILLFGEDCLQTWKAIQPRQPAQTSATFAQAGQYVIRDSWGAKTDVAYFRCGAFGLGGEGHCAHAHSDLLSVVLWLNGQPLLVDSGTYMYHGEWRNYFRCSAAHNTVKVDQSDQAFPEPNFNWRHVKEARCISWDAQQVSGEFSFDAVTFRRTLFHPHRGVWCLDDVFTGNDEHTFDWYFNFAPGLTLQQDACVFKIFQGGDLLASIEIPFEITTLEQTTGWYSKTYAVKKPITTLHAQWHGNMSEQGISFHWRINGMHIQEETERGEYVTSV